MTSSPKIEPRDERHGWLALAAILGWWAYDAHFHWLGDTEYQFGWIVLALCAYLGWDRWESRPRTRRTTARPLWIAMTLGGAALIIVAECFKHAISRTPAATFTLSVGCVLVACAVILQRFGPAYLRHFAFPILFFFLAVPIPQIIWNPVVHSLQDIVARVNVEVLNLAGVPARRTAHVIQLPNAVVGVNEACSGIRSLQSSVMAALFVADLIIKSVMLRIVFLIAGVLLAVTGNLIRSLYLSFSAYRGGEEAVEGAHDTAGWSILLFTMCGLAVLAWMIHRLDIRSTGEPDAERSVDK